MDFIDVTRIDDYALVSLNRGKVNAINHQMVIEIRQTFSQLQDEPAIRGVIITGKPHYFSAGLDVIELYEYNFDQIKHFWLDFLGMMIDLVKFTKPLIAAISGHSPAGGAIIALTCDYRMMAEGEKYLIGLNEVAVGINITESIFALYSFWLGNRVAYQSLYSGRLYNVQDARAIGLVDQIVELEDLQEAAVNKLKLSFLANDFILQDTKSVMRSELISRIDVDLTEEVERRCAYWMSPQSREEIGRLVNRIAGK